MNEALRDCFVYGICSEAIQKKLLTISDLSFAIAVEVAEGMKTEAITSQEVKKLDRLEQEGVLKRVNFSEWASPIVPVPKKDGQFRESSRPHKKCMA